MREAVEWECRVGKDVTFVIPPPPPLVSQRKRRCRSCEIRDVPMRRYAMRYVTGFLGTPGAGIRGRVPTTQAVPPDIPCASLGTSRTRFRPGLIMFTSESQARL